MFRHIATINEENICFAVWSGNWTGERELNENEMFVESPSVMGMKHENGKWVEVEVEPAEPEPTQLDRIESMIAKSQEEIAQEARDAYTLELIEGGVIA